MPVRRVPPILDDRGVRNEIRQPISVSTHYRRRDLTAVWVSLPVTRPALGPSAPAGPAGLFLAGVQQVSDTSPKSEAEGTTNIDFR